MITYGHMLEVQKAAKLSPEQLAKGLGISGMTLRRWKNEHHESPLPSLYCTALMNVVLQLVIEEKLSPTDPTVSKFIEKCDSISFNTVVKSLGLTEEFLKNATHENASVVEALAQIGSQQKKNGIVESNSARIKTYGKYGPIWAQRIKVLTGITKNKNFATFEKAVAVGALFYLLNPFDLIPDHFPVFGLIDDFAILGIAVNYYLKRKKLV